MFYYNAWNKSRTSPPNGVLQPKSNIVHVHTCSHHFDDMTLNKSTCRKCLPRTTSFLGETFLDNKVGHVRGVQEKCFRIRKKDTYRSEKWSDENHEYIIKEERHHYSQTNLKRKVNLQF